MSSDAGGVDDDPVPFPAVGPVRRRVYEPNPKHGPVARGSVSAGPRNGQDALDVSVLVKSTSGARVGIDYDEGTFVVFRRHNGPFPVQLEHEIFHGYVVHWEWLKQEQKNALMRAGMADLKGRITR